MSVPFFRGAPNKRHERIRKREVHGSYPHRAPVVADEEIDARVLDSRQRRLARDVDQLKPHVRPVEAAVTLDLESQPLPTPLRHSVPE